MATVNLNNIFKKPVNPNSAIKYVYQDFNILTMETLYGNQINSKPVKSDLNVSYDMRAVRNSISNILTTKKSQKILSPEFGLRLEDFLFEPVTDSTAAAIQEEITNAIQTYEPRVTIQFLQVVPFPEDNKYEINLGVRVPTLKTTLSLKGTVQSDAITIL